MDEVLRGLRNAGGSVRYQAAPANYPPTLQPALDRCKFLDFASAAAAIAGRSILMIGDCFERRLLEYVCSKLEVTTIQRRTKRRPSHDATKNAANIFTMSATFSISCVYVYMHADRMHRQGA